jgi:hypothetical protein
MGGACGRFGGRKGKHKGFWWGSLNERHYIENLLDLKQIGCQN